MHGCWRMIWTSRPFVQKPYCKWEITPTNFNNLSVLEIIFSAKMVVFRLYVGFTTVSNMLKWKELFQSIRKYSGNFQRKYCIIWNDLSLWLFPVRLQLALWPNTSISVNLMRCDGFTHKRQVVKPRHYSFIILISCKLKMYPWWIVRYYNTWWSCQFENLHQVTI